MATHDIIVVGASSGGVEALIALVRGLPPDLQASVFVVLHVSPGSPSILPQLLDKAGPLPASHASDEDEIEHGRIYVAPPDHHLLVAPGLVRVVRGPRENRSRPAIDPLFRTAAVAYGQRVVGVVLTGTLDDGTAGMVAIKTDGGIAVVQDPKEALYPSMPLSVLEQVDVDHCLPVAQIAALLERLAKEDVVEQEGEASMDAIELEAQIAEQRLTPSQLREKLNQLGEVTTLTCPDCHGSLWELRDQVMPRYRCHVGHAYTAKSLIVDQGNGVEAALWSAMRSLEERVMLMRRMVELTKANAAISADYVTRAAETERHAATLRQLLLTRSDDLHPKDD